MYSFLFLIIATASANALYSSSDKVIELTDKSFKSRVKGSDSIWIVEFYAPWCGHCQQLAPEFKKAAEALHGIVNVGAIDCDQEKSMAQEYNIRGFPTIKMFIPGKSSPVDYNAGRTADALVSEALSQIRTLVSQRTGGKSGSGGDSGKSDVIDLTESNFNSLVLNSDDLWMVEFFAPWCGHCKNLKPEYEVAARELKSKVKLGAVDATVHQSLASKYNVNGYPTLLIFGADKTNPQPYEGGRSSKDIVNFMEEKAMANLPPPKAEELTSQAQLDLCNEKQLCVIAALPDLFDCQSKCRNDYIKMLEKAGEKHKTKNWMWFWISAIAQPDVESKMNMGGFGYPAMVAYNAKKAKFAPFRGSFSAEGIHEFLRDVSLGSRSIALFDVASMPTVKSTTAWDGMDGKLPVDEEIDLASLRDDL